jgi:hypothetical protein
MLASLQRIPAGACSLPSTHTPALHRHVSCLAPCTAAVQPACERLHSLVGAGSPLSVGCSQMLAEEVDCPAGRIINASTTTHRMKAMTSVVEGVTEPLASKPRVGAGAAALVLAGTLRSATYSLTPVLTAR